jgi:hypothetical protein
MFEGVSGALKGVWSNSPETASDLRDDGYSQDWRAEDDRHQRDDQDTGGHQQSDMVASGYGEKGKKKKMDRKLQK